MKCLRDGLPIQGLQQFADTFAGHPASGDLWPEIYARVRDTYVSRLKLKL